MSGDEATDKLTELVTLVHAMLSEQRAFSSRVMTGYEAAHGKVIEMADTLSRTAKDAQDAVSKSLTMQMSVVEERERLMSRNHTRELEAQAAQQKMRASGELTREFHLLLKLIAKKYFLGVPLTGNDSHGLQDLLQSMSPDQLETLMVSGQITLTPSQRQMLAATVMSLGEAEAKSEAKSLPEPEPEPKAEAAE